MVRSGHAAIMVGTGFSKNASPNGTSTRGFPDQQQLGDLFHEKVNGTKPDNKGKYLNVLKLADEVQAAPGRPALDQALRDVIPDYESCKTTGFTMDGCIYNKLRYLT